MKEIYLPLAQSVSAVIDIERIRKEGSATTLADIYEITFNDIVKDETSTSIITARKNGGEVLYATLAIEHQINSILLGYFMGRLDDGSIKRYLFSREILQSSALSFAAKKELLKHIIQEESVIKGKSKDELQSLLKQIMTWRNAFAHGNLEYHANRGCLTSSLKCNRCN